MSKFMQLTTHFNLSELIKSQVATRYGIDNTPNKEQIKNLIRLCVNVLEPIRVHRDNPLIISSGFRCKKVK